MSNKCACRFYSGFEAEVMQLRFSALISVNICCRFGRKYLNTSVITAHFKILNGTVCDLLKII